MSVTVRGVYAEHTDEIHIITDRPGKNGEYLVHKFYLNHDRLIPCGDDYISENQACNLTSDGQTLEEGYTADANAKQALAAEAAVKH